MTELNYLKNALIKQAGVDPWVAGELSDHAIRLGLSHLPVTEIMSAVVAKIDTRDGRKSATQPSRNLADYKRSASDTILEATSHCIVSLGASHPQLSQADRTKFCQEIAAQSTKDGGIYHVTLPSLQSASVQKQDEVPAWLKTHDALSLTRTMAELRNPEEAVETVELTPQQSQLKQASVAVGDIKGDLHPHIQRIQRLMGEGRFV